MAGVPMTAPDRQQVIADALAAHQPVIQGSGGFFTCSCRDWGWGDRREGTYAQHLAAAALAASTPAGVDHDEG
jgi:hypothetical protein